MNEFQYDKEKIFKIPFHAASPDDWRQALARVVPAVVVLRVTVVRAFDTEVASSSYATGFVVDKKRGIILTNRHVVKPGIYKYTVIPCNLKLVNLCW